MEKTKSYIPEPYFACGECGEKLSRCDMCCEPIVYGEDAELYCDRDAGMHYCVDCVEKKLNTQETQHIDDGYDENKDPNGFEKQMMREREGVNF